MAIYDQDEEFLKTAINWGGKEIDRHSITYTFDDLKEGIYAVSIFHDENDNGKLDANFMGFHQSRMRFQIMQRENSAPQASETVRWK